MPLSRFSKTIKSVKTEVEAESFITETWFNKDSAENKVRKGLEQTAKDELAALIEVCERKMEEYRQQQGAAPASSEDDRGAHDAELRSGGRGQGASASGLAADGDFDSVFSQTDTCAASVHNDRDAQPLSAPQDSLATEGEFNRGSLASASQNPQFQSLSRFATAHHSLSSPAALKTAFVPAILNWMGEHYANAYKHGIVTVTETHLFSADEEKDLPVLASQEFLAKFRTKIAQLLEAARLCDAATSGVQGSLYDDRKLIARISELLGKADHESLSFVKALPY